MTEIQDISRPVSRLYTRWLRLHRQGLNLKVGQTYDTVKQPWAWMFLKSKVSLVKLLVGTISADDSIDSIRFRNFIRLTNGRGTQVDMSWDFDSNQGSASYSFIQAFATNGHV